MKTLNLKPFGQVWPLGRLSEAVALLPHPERTATKSVGMDFAFVEFTSRAFMAKAIRQGERGSNGSKFRPVVKLGETEGY